jgi:hypothetical protein
VSLPIEVDEHGLRLPAGLDDACDVLFDGAHVWSFSPAEQGKPEDGGRFVRWPRAMHPWLDGVATVTVTAGGHDLFSSELTFGQRSDRIRFVDKDGIPVMIDKWGLLQRPFSGRGTGVVEHMVEMTERILATLKQDCGIEAWIAFGTLLGAARSGKVIGYDSDIDLAYLSHQATPAAMAREMFGMTRALRRRGMRVLNKSGSFITVLFTSPDGGQGSIDIYTTFYVGEMLHETATVRAPVPRGAVEPLSTIEFEGRPLPAPADPDVLLTASYGPDWRIPDPSFRHRPGPEVKQRFDPWFGNLMRHRRDWERTHRNAGPHRSGSDFSRWVAARLRPDGPVIDVGTGTGADALAFAAQGRRTVGLDYARGSTTAAARRAEQRGLPATFLAMNLYDLRDVLTMAALLARTTAGPRTLYARGLLDALDADGQSNFWRFARLLLDGGGDLFLELAEGPSQPDPDRVRDRAEAAGGRLTELDRVSTAGAPLRRMAVAWTSS